MRTFLSLLVFAFGLFGCQLTDSQAQSTRSASTNAHVQVVESLMSLPEQGPTSAPGHHKTNATVQANVHHVKMAVDPQYRRLLFSAEQVVNVRLRLQAADVGSTERPPLELALVLDTSGSMSGNKLRDAKAAAMSLISGLDTRDRVTLIAYASHVHRVANRVIMDDAGRRRLTQHILGLKAGGSTALGPALVDAAHVLGQASGSSLMLRHVILMSDGVANVGESRPDILAMRARQAFRDGISLSTMGVGLDYNEDLMTKIANMGGGRYHFIEDSAKIAAVLKDEFQGLVATIARDVHVAIKPTPGVRLVKVHGYPVHATEYGSSIQIGCMGRRQTREVMMQFIIAQGLSPAKDEFLAQFTLTYADIVRDARTMRHDAQLRVGLATTLEQQRQSENTDVTIRLAEVESSAQLEIAARSVSAGNYGEARRVMNHAIQKLKREHRATPSPKLTEQLHLFEAAAGDMVASEQSAAARKRVAKKYKARAYQKSK
ncbi:MAG: VWA domain-containing protein [Myxococcota bacterium]|nr:VWA domain-containing protein [Myxococcota bacterium]